MHILHVVQLYHGASGASRYFIELGERLVQDGHRVTVLATDAFDLEHLWAKGKRRIEARHETHHGVQVRRLAVQPMPGPALFYPILRRAMRELGRLPGSTPLLRRLATITPRLPELPALLNDPALADVDLVHVTNITLDFMALPLVAWAQQRRLRLLCTPFVHLGEPDDPKIVGYYSMPHMLDLMQQAEAILTMTGLERDFLRQRGLPDERLHIIGAGITPSEVTGGDATRFRAKHSLSGPIVLSLGAAAFDKGTIHVLEAMRRLWANGHPAHWVQLGPQLDHVRAYLAGLNESEQRQICALGYVDPEERRDGLAAADLLAMPSRTDSFGIVYLEAWCNRTPVIGAWAGGVPAVIRDGVDGVLVRFGDTEALQQQIHRLLEDRAWAEQLGAAGYERVQKELTWEHVYRRAKPLYEG